MEKISLLYIYIYICIKYLLVVLATRMALFVIKIFYLFSFVFAKLNDFVQEIEETSRNFTGGGQLHIMSEDMGSFWILKFGESIELCPLDSFHKTCAFHYESVSFNFSYPLICDKRSLHCIWVLYLNFKNKKIKITSSDIEQ